ncbi:MAG: Hsp20/alpha crystallin family protein [Thermoflavifilum aggregans]|nr:Hsp20/alpha crystallin family protein [Thermoflavifilum aggregans]
MSLIKWNESEVFPSFSQLLDEFFGDDWFRGVQTGTRVPAVNIHETNTSYELELAAPGLKKSDFKISVDGDVLTISAEKKEEKEEKHRKVTRREFNFTSFSRSFTLPDSVDVDKIKASYEDGVLKLELPKKEIAVKQAPKEISVE